MKKFVSLAFVRPFICRMCCFLLFSFVNSSALQLLAQPAPKGPIVVSGVVQSPQGDALEGVSVTLKGTKTATLTNKEGRYNIRVPSRSSVLVFSSVGFTEQQKTVGSETSITIILSSTTSDLDDVVVIGYGTAIRKDLTGSVGKVSVADLQKAPVRSFEEALAGRVAGVQVSSGDGQPGDPLNIVIRGNSSLTNSNAPLYVIDGFPIENPDNNALNPADIESIDVLRDASATAIYGSRGSNGVVIITTKKGRIGEPVVTYNGYYANSIVTSRVKLMDTYEFLRLQREINPAFVDTTYLKGGKDLESFRGAPGLDFQDQLFQTAPFWNHYISVSGGTDKTKYSISGSLTDQDGIIVASGFDRRQGRISLEQKVNNKLKIFVNANYADTRQFGTTPREQTSTTGGNDIQFNLLQNVWTYRPVNSSGVLDDILDQFLDQEDGNAPGNRVNPLSSARNEYNVSARGNFSANGYADYAFDKYLSLRVTGGVVVDRRRNENFNNTGTRAGSPLTQQGRDNGPNGRVDNSISNNFSLEGILTYKRKFNKHELTAQGIYSQQDFRSSATGISANRVPNEKLGISGLDEGQITGYRSSSSQNSLLSYGGRINYIFDNRYVFNSNFRADGSSKFPTGGKWGYFPSAGFAWKLSEERFMKKVQFVSDVKLSLAAGTSGNNRIGDFAYLPNIVTNNSGAYATFGNTLVQGFFPSSVGNDKLKWEKTTSYNAGLEFSLLNGKIYTTLEYYQKNTSDLLLSAPFPTSSGFSSGVINIGKTQNSGVELSISANTFKSRNFSWNSSFNISFNRNKLVGLVDGTDNIGSFPGFTDAFRFNGYIARIDYPIAQFYGFIFDGNYQYADFDRLPSGGYALKNEIAAPNGGLVNLLRTNVQPGDPKYRDINGDGLIDDNDQTVIGNPNPVHTGGLNNNFTYKNFDLNVFFQWSVGNEALNANRLFLERVTGLGVNQFASYADRWTPDNPSNYASRVLAGGTNVWSSRIIEDASYLRLKTVAIGYNIPNKYLRKIGLKSCRVYSSAQNLITWTKYSGPDPEVSTKGFGLTPAFDFSPYPRSLTYTFGLNLTL